MNSKESTALNEETDSDEDLALGDLTDEERRILEERRQAEFDLVAKFDKVHRVTFCFFRHAFTYLSFVLALPLAHHYLTIDQSSLSARPSIYPSIQQPKDGDQSSEGMLVSCFSKMDGCLGEVYGESNTRASWSNFQPRSLQTRW